MKPTKTIHENQEDLFKVELKRIINLDHGLVKLGNQMDWESFDNRFEKYYCEESRPGIETRLIVSLHYLKYLGDLSDHYCPNVNPCNTSCFDGVSSSSA